MNLAFSTKFDNGDPTFFVEKIWESIYTQKAGNQELLNGCYDRGFTGVMKNGQHYPKIHTIRQDKKNRWKEGNKIHFVINNRTPQRYQFAPVVLCERIQQIRMTVDGPFFHIAIDGKPLDMDQKRMLAMNDGFNLYRDFLSWFRPRVEKDGPFVGKLIHWTGFKY